MCNSCFGNNSCMWIILLILLCMAFSSCGNNGGCPNAASDCGCGC